MNGGIRSPWCCPTGACACRAASTTGRRRDGFMPRAEIAGYFDAYARRIKAPVRYNVNVMSIEPDETGKRYTVTTSDKTYLARNVVMATGESPSTPRRPPFSADIPRRSGSSTQRSIAIRRRCRRAPCWWAAGSRRRSPRSSTRAGVRSTSSVGGAGRIPRRYRGPIRCVAGQVGLLRAHARPDARRPVERFAAPHVSGRDGGHDLQPACLRP